jgi:hypothetical protein
MWFWTVYYNTLYENKNSHQMLKNNKKQQNAEKKKTQEHIRSRIPPPKNIKQESKTQNEKSQIITTSRHHLNANHHNHPSSPILAREQYRLAMQTQPRKSVIRLAHILLGNPPDQVNGASAQAREPGQQRVPQALEAHLGLRPVDTRGVKGALGAVLGAAGLWPLPVVGAEGGVEVEEGCLGGGVARAQEGVGEE